MAAGLGRTLYSQPFPGCPGRFRHHLQQHGFDGSLSIYRLGCCSPSLHRRAAGCHRQCAPVWDFACRLSLPGTPALPPGHPAPAFIPAGQDLPVSRTPGACPLAGLPQRGFAGAAGRGYRIPWRASTCAVWHLRWSPSWSGWLHSLFWQPILSSWLPSCSSGFASPVLGSPSLLISWQKRPL